MPHPLRKFAGVLNCIIAKMSVQCCKMWAECELDVCGCWLRAERTGPALSGEGWLLPWLLQPYISCTVYCDSPNNRRHVPLPGVFTVFVSDVGSPCAPHAAQAPSLASVDGSRHHKNSPQLYDELLNWFRMLNVPYSDRNWSWSFLLLPVNFNVFHYLNTVWICTTKLQKNVSEHRSNLL